MNPLFGFLHFIIMKHLFQLLHTSRQQLKDVEKMMVNDAFEAAADAKHLSIIQHFKDFYGDRLSVILNSFNKCSTSSSSLSLSLIATSATALIFSSTVSPLKIDLD